MPASWGRPDWILPRVVKLHNLAYIVLAFFAVMTLKFTRRTGGFRITPMDFIVVVLALAVTTLPREILPGGGGEERDPEDTGVVFRV